MSESIAFCRKGTKRIFHNGKKEWVMKGSQEKFDFFAIGSAENFRAHWDTCIDQGFEYLGEQVSTPYHFNTCIFKHCHAIDIEVNPNDEMRLQKIYEIKKVAYVSYSEVEFLKNSFMSFDLADLLIKHFQKRGYK